ncbi:MAG TPA: glycosyltransferase family 1 protein [Candidatus Angelobacter sp.]|nr:glycosyltransferase family 1 protein [Candidatus Angelobacter sp.]
MATRFRHQGTYVYARSLITEFKKITTTRPEIQFSLFTSPNNSNDAAQVGAARGFELTATSLLAHQHLWRIGGANIAAARTHAGLIFAPALSLLPVGRIPVVCTIHDVTPVVMPSHSLKVTLWQRTLLRSSAKRARAIIAVSVCSKNDLLRIYGIPESRVFVVYNGYDKANFNDAPADPERQKNLLARLRLDKPYILHHGVVQPRKNLKRLIEAWRLLRSRNPNLEFDLVLAGQRGWEYQEILAAGSNRAANQGRVVFPGVLDDPDLAMLIKGASLVVMPSLYEGFCLPMVEAMACGVPTIASNNSCLPEISGGVLKYFDPLSIEEMAACMEQALEDGVLRQRLIQEGKRRAATFDWATCAEKTLAVLEGCIDA